MNHTMKLLLLITALAYSSGCLALSSPCERVEYAELKDMSRAELTTGFCKAKALEAHNAALYKIAKESYEARTSKGDPALEQGAQMEERGQAQISCIKAAESNARMLQRKFGAKPPNCQK